MSPKKLIILGIGGTSLELVDIVNDINQAHDDPVYEVVGFLDDNDTTWGTKFRDLKVLGPLASAKDHPDACFVNGIGSERNFFLKEQLINSLGCGDDRFETLIHPTASVSGTAVVGRGSVLHQYVVLQNGVRLGRHVLICPFSLIGHNVMVGDYSTVSIQVGVIGYVKVGRGCYLGANSSILCDVGNGSLIGMASVVVKEVGPNKVVAGNPARVLREVR